MDKYIEWASGQFLTQNIPFDMLVSADDDTLEQFVSDHVYFEYDCADPADVLELIYNLANDIAQTFTFKE